MTSSFVYKTHRHRFTTVANVYYSKHVHVLLSVCTLSAALFLGDQTTADTAYFYQDMYDTHTNQCHTYQIVPHAQMTIQRLWQRLSNFGCQHHLIWTENTRKFCSTDTMIQIFRCPNLVQINLFLNFVSRGSVRVRSVFTSPVFTLSDINCSYFLTCILMYFLTIPEHAPFWHQKRWK